MWWMNNVMNPLVRWILSGPLHGLMSKSTLLIAYQGRKSGKRFTLPTQYLQTGKEVWIVVGYPEKKQWWKNFASALPVSLCLRGEWVSGMAVALSGEKDRAELTRGLTEVVHLIPEYYGPRFESALQPGSDLEGIVLVKVALD
jgi:Domain of unknown function (DUF385).